MVQAEVPAGGVGTPSAATPKGMLLLPPSSDATRSPSLKISIRVIFTAHPGALSACGCRKRYRRSPPKTPAGMCANFGGTNLITSFRMSSHLCLAAAIPDRSEPLQPSQQERGMYMSVRLPAWRPAQPECVCFLGLLSAFILSFPSAGWKRLWIQDDQSASKRPKQLAGLAQNLSSVANTPEIVKSTDVSLVCACN